MKRTHTQGIGSVPQVLAGSRRSLSSGHRWRESPCPAWCSGAVRYRTRLWVLSLDSARHLCRMHSLSRVSLAEMICSDSLADDIDAGNAPEIEQSFTSLPPHSAMQNKWPSPLENYQGPRDPLPTEFNPDGRSLKNTPAPKSSVWHQAPKPFVPNHANFDFHGGYRRAPLSLGFLFIYYPVAQSTTTEATRMKPSSHASSTRGFEGNSQRYIYLPPPSSKDISPLITIHAQLMIFRFREEPVGPHPAAMFEVDTFTPHETGALFTWLAVNRGPLS